MGGKGHQSSWPFPCQAQPAPKVQVWRLSFVGKMMMNHGMVEFPEIFRYQTQIKRVTSAIWGKPSRRKHISIFSMGFFLIIADLRVPLCER